MTVWAAISVDTQASNRMHVVRSTEVKLQFGATVKRCITAIYTTAVCVTNMGALVV